MYDKDLCFNPISIQIQFSKKWSFSFNFDKLLWLSNKGRKIGLKLSKLWLVVHRSLEKYSSRKWMLVLCCLMKQNCYFQRGVAECRHAATPLSSYSINTTHQGFQKRYITLFYLKGLKSYQPSKLKCLHFTPLSIVNWTFHLHFCWYLLSPLRYNKVEYLFWKPWSMVLML